MSEHIIHERSCYLDYVFGYDDTERIVVRFELGPEDAVWKVQVLALTDWMLIDKETFEPTLGYAEEVLEHYWQEQNT